MRCTHANACFDFGDVPTREDESILSLGLMKAMRRLRVAWLSAALATCCGSGGQAESDVDGGVRAPLEVVDIVGGDHGEAMCLLLSDGTVACWGDNSSGVLGRGQFDDASYPKPRRVVGLNRVSRLALDYESACAVRSNGSLLCWVTIQPASSGRGTPTRGLCLPPCSVTSGRLSQQPVSGWGAPPARSASTTALSAGRVAWRRDQRCDCDPGGARIPAGGQDGDWAGSMLD